MASQKFSPSDLSELQQLAEDYLGTCSFRNFVCCREFIRDKSRNYFNNILTSEGGVMVPYKKDNHGDPRSPLNKTRSGLFFSPLLPKVNADTSIYGKCRFQVKASALIDGSTRAYFADFYCVPGKNEPRPHYVTVVLTRAGSSDDRFCRQNLIELDVTSNPFFQVLSSGASVRVMTARRFHVEIFYTENVNIRRLISSGLASLTDVTLAEYGSEWRRPRPKSSSCTLCNLPEAPRRASSIRTRENRRIIGETAPRSVYSPVQHNIYSSQTRPSTTQSNRTPWQHSSSYNYYGGHTESRNIEYPKVTKKDDSWCNIL